MPKSTKLPPVAVAVAALPPVAVLPDAKTQAATGGAVERAQVLRALASADVASRRGMLDALNMTIIHGPTSTDEVTKHWTTCGTPAVYSSYFNLGSRAAAVIGEAKALKIVADAAKLPGAAFVNARAALSKVIGAAKTAKVKEFTPGNATKAIKTALQEVAAKASEPKAAAPKTGARVAKTPDAAKLGAGVIAATLQATPMHIASMTLQLSRACNGMAVPNGREEAFHAAVRATREAAEAWAVFGK